MHQSIVDTLPHSHVRIRLCLLSCCLIVGDEIVLVVSIQCPMIALQSIINDPFIFILVKDISFACKTTNLDMKAFPEFLK